MSDYESEETTETLVCHYRSSGSAIEEFQHYYGNATFDDEATMHSAGVPASNLPGEKESLSSMPPCRMPLVSSCRASTTMVDGPSAIL